MIEELELGVFFPLIRLGQHAHLSPPQVLELQEYKESSIRCGILAKAQAKKICYKVLCLVRDVYDLNDCYDPSHKSELSS